MQDALSDGTPMVVFTGQVPTSAIGSDAFQEADIIGISRACTKWYVAVDIVPLQSVFPLKLKDEMIFVCTSWQVSYDLSHGCDTGSAEILLHDIPKPQYVY